MISELSTEQVLVLGIVLGIVVSIVGSRLWRRTRLLGLRRFAAREYRRQTRERELEAAMRVSDRRPGFYLGEWYPR